MSQNTKCFTRISHDEISLLSGLPHFYQLLYFYLSSKVDRESGLVGAKDGCKVSIRAIAEWLFIEPGQGLKGSGSPTRKKIRVALKALERAGLLEPRSIVTHNKKQLILFLPYAKWDYSVRKKEGLLRAYQRDLGPDLLLSAETLVNPSESEEGPQKDEPKKETLETLKAGTPQYTNCITTTTTTVGNLISSNFKPSEETLQKASELHLLEFNNPIELQKFISYNRGSGTKSHDWDQLYLRWLINAKQFQQQKENDHDKKRKHDSTAKRHWSAVDEVRRRNKLFSNHTVIDVKPDHEGRYRLALGEDDPLLRS